jgi:hypothetical protein
MKHPFKIITLTLAALVMLAYATHADGQSHDVPSVVTVTVSLPRGGIVDIHINNYENPSKNDGNKALWLFMDSPIPERRLSH